MHNDHYCRCYHENEGGEGKFLTGLLIGGVIGAGIVIYFSTDQGKAKLKELRKKMEGYKDELRGKMEEIKEQKIEPLISEAKDEFRDTVKRLKVAVAQPKPRKAR